MTPVACAVCGATSREATVASGLIRWAERDGRLSVTAAPRCTDRAACRRRVEAAGEAWEVLDAEDRKEARA